MTERAPSSILNEKERAMYERFMQDPSHSGWSEIDFKEFRDFALSRANSSGMNNFFAVNGIIMEEKDLPDAEEIKDTHQ